MCNNNNNKFFCSLPIFLFSNFDSRNSPFEIIAISITIHTQKKIGIGMRGRCWWIQLFFSLIIQETAGLYQDDNWCSDGMIACFNLILIERIEKPLFFFLMFACVWARIKLKLLRNLFFFLYFFEGTNIKEIKIKEQKRPPDNLICYKLSRQMIPYFSTNVSHW